MTLRIHVNCMYVNPALKEIYLNHKDNLIKTFDFFFIMYIKNF